MALFLTSCNSYRHTMREPNNHVEFVASDFELSDAVTGEATVTNVLGIDWSRIFGTTHDGFVTSRYDIPIVGTLVVNNGINAALYDMMQKNPGYDVVFYPQVESYRHAPILGTDLYSTTTYKVTARLGKLKK